MRIIVIDVDWIAAQLSRRRTGIQDCPQLFLPRELNEVTAEAAGARSDGVSRRSFQKRHPQGDGRRRTSWGSGAWRFSDRGWLCEPQASDRIRALNRRSTWAVAGARLVDPSCGSARNVRRHIQHSLDAAFGADEVGVAAIVDEPRPCRDDLRRAGRIISVVEGRSQGIRGLLDRYPANRAFARAKPAPRRACPVGSGGL